MERQDWQCPHCTLRNSAVEACQACGSHRPPNRPHSVGSVVKRVLEFFGVKDFAGGAITLLGACTGAAAVAYATSRGARAPFFRNASIGAVAGAVLSQKALHLSSRFSRTAPRTPRSARRRRGPPGDNWEVGGSDSDAMQVSDEVREAEVRQLLAIARRVARASPQHRQRLALVNLLLQTHREQIRRGAGGAGDLSLPLALAHQQLDALIDTLSYEELYEYFGGPRSAPAPATEAALLALPITTLSSQDCLQGVGQKAVRSCSICLEEFRRGVCVRCLPICGHVFHVWCVDRWLRQRGDCPLCRRQLTPSGQLLQPPAVQLPQPPAMHASAALTASS